MSKKNRSNRYSEEVGTAATLSLAGVGLASLLPQEFFGNVRQAVYHSRHAGKTVVDAARGGPEGMRAAKNLEQAIQIVRDSTSDNTQAKEALQAYIAERQDFTNELTTAYKENEVVSRVADRLLTQLQGTTKSLFEAGNSLKPKFVEKIDDLVVRAYGQDPTEARENSGRLKKFYDEVEDFYASREKNEHTVKEFCNHLKTVRDESIERNQEYNNLFPEVIARVREGYETEDTVFEAGDKNILGLRTGISKSALEEVNEQVDGFEENVDHTYSTVEDTMPIAPYKEPTWIEYGINPITMGLAGALAVQGATHLVPGGRLVRKAVSSPIRALANGSKRAGKWAYSLARRGNKQIKPGKRQDLNTNTEKDNRSENDSKA